jgi:hypothetical protein
MRRMGIAGESRRWMANELASHIPCSQHHRKLPVGKTGAGEQPAMNN